MNKFFNTLSEIAGRGAVVVLSVTGINRTSWYQSFDGQIPLTNPWGWLIAFFTLLAIFWIVLPIIRNMKVKRGDKK